MLDKFLSNYLLKLFEDEIEEFIKENSDIEYDKDFNRIKTKNSKSDLFIVINNPNISLTF